MREIFADTFFWIAITNPRERSKEKAYLIQKELEHTTLVTTDEVLIEFLAFYSKKGQGLRKRAATFVRRRMGDPSVRIIEQSRDSFLSGLDLYEQRLDKGYSATDCISMQAMIEGNITEVLTNDEHFEQEGFKALFRE